MLVTGGLYDAQGQGRINQTQFVHSLLDEFIPVRQDKRAASTPLNEEGKHNGFARPRR